MEANFSKPQRQSLTGVLVIFVGHLQKVAKGVWPVVLLTFVKHKTFEPLLFMIGALVLYSGILAYLKYLNFTFYIDDETDEFIVKEGIFKKTKTIVRLDKIQQVNINQSLIQRIIRVYALDIDTAGTDRKESEIKAVSHDLAIALKTKLLENESKTAAAATPVEERETLTAAEPPFLKINLSSLLKIGITSKYVETVFLISFFCFKLWDDFKKIGYDSILGYVKLSPFFKGNAVGYAVLILTFTIITVIFIVNIVRTLIRFFDYTISRQKGSLVLHYGLFDTKSTLLKPEKIQTVIVSRNYFQKKLDVLSIKIKQSVGRLEKSRIEIPGCNALESDEILQLLFKQLPAKGVMMKPNFRKLVFSVFLKIILPLTAYVLFGNYVNAVVFDYLNFAIGYSVFFGIIQFFGYRNYRLFVNEDHIIKQSGAWDIDTEIIQIDKIQALTTSQLFWHKSLNIGSLTIHTAGGNITFHLGKFDKIKQYVNLWLYKLETSDSNWM